MHPRWLLMHESALLHRVVLVMHSDLEKIKTIKRLASYSPHGGKGLLISTFGLGGL